MKIVKTFGFSFILFIGFALVAGNNEYTKIQFDNFETQKYACDCILSIATTYFPKGSIIGMISSTNQISGKFKGNAYQIIATDMMMEMRWSFVTMDGSKFTGQAESTAMEKVDNYITMVKTELEVMISLKMLVATLSWNPRAKFLIFVDWLERDWRAFTIFILEQFWAYYVIDIIICVPTSEADTQPKLVTWLPFDDNNRGIKVSNIIELAVCNDSRISVQNNLFPNTVLNNLNGCKLDVLLFDREPYVTMSAVNTIDGHAAKIIKLYHAHQVDGIDVRLLKAIAKQLNFEPQYYLAGQEVRNDFVGTGYSSLRELTLIQRIPIIVGGLIPHLNVQRFHDYSMPYLQSELVLVANKMNFLPHWVGMIQILQPLVWLASSIACAFVCLVIWLLAKYAQEEVRNYRELHRIVLRTAQLMVGSIPYGTPRTTYIRCVVLLWSFFCLNFYSAYTSSLISMITKPMNRAGFRTIEDVFKDNIPVGAAPYIYNYVVSNNGTSYHIRSAVTENFRMCESIYVCLDRVTKDNRFVALSNRIFFDYYKLANFTNAYGEPMIGVIPGNFITAPIELLTSKGYPLLNVINGVILRMSEAGLVQFWTRNLLREEAHRSAINWRSRGRHYPLGWEHLKGAFFVLTMGYVLSMLTICMEIFWAKKHLGKKMIRGIRKAWE